MRISILDSPGSGDLVSARQVAEALSFRFPRVDVGIPTRHLAAGDILLTIGVGRWTRGSVIQELHDAGSRGVKRVLWQLEPLPPSVEGWPNKILQADLHSESKRRNSDSSFAAPVSAAIAFTLKTAWFISMAGGSHVEATMREAGKLLSYPLKQARDIVSLSRTGLLDHILVSVASRKKFLAQHGVPSEFVPVGYMPEFGSVIPGVERDVDVLFLGHVTARRRELLASLQSHLQCHGRSILVVERNCYGEERTRLMNRSKIILNLQRFTWEFPIIRLLVAMGCKTLAVSERASDPGPFLEDRHLVLRDASELGEALVTYLAKDEERSRIVDEAHEFVTKNFTLANLLSDALSKISASSTIERVNG